MRLVALGRLGFFFALGVKGSGFIFNNVRRTSSSLGGFVVMPQPLSKLLKHGERAGFSAGIPLENAELCAHAMNVIALWSIVERDAAMLVATMTPGKAAPIAAIFFSSRADSPKSAVRSALAAAFLAPLETQVFDALMIKYEAGSKLRNPLAHWALGKCVAVPDAIVAINPEAYVQINAANEAETNNIMRDLGDPEKSHLKPLERISEEGVSSLMAVYQKHLDKMCAYRLTDLTGIERDLNALAEMLRAFATILRLGHLKISPGIRARQLRKLCQQLELPQPTAE